MAEEGASAVLKQTQEDPRFVRGRELLKEKRFEEAIEVLADMLRTMIETEDKAESLAVAPVYYEYGHAMLSLAEVTASVFGSAVQEEGTSDEQQAKNTADDLEVAWENLELARVLLSKHHEELSDESEDKIALEKELARVYMRLGDLGMESEVFERARADYEKSVLLRKQVLAYTKDRDTTPLADLYCCLAISCIYEDATPSTEESKEPEVSKVVEKEKNGLEYYVLAGKVMAENIHRVSSDCSDSIKSFVDSRIPRFDEPEGKGKKKATVDVDYLPFLLESGMTSVKEDFASCLQAAESKEDKMSKDEETLLEYMEIYVELKEKVDGLRESIQTSKEETKEVETTVGFEKREREPETVNVMQVKKRKTE